MNLHKSLFNNHQIKAILHVVAFMLPIMLHAQSELIGPEPDDRGKLGRWKVPDLLPEKYAKKLEYHAITYGEKGMRPLPSTAFGYKIHDWNEDGIGDIVGCNSPFHEGNPYIRVYLSSGGNDPTFTNPDEAQVILDDQDLGRYFELMDVNYDGRIDVVTFTNDRELIAFLQQGTWQQPTWNKVYIEDPSGNRWAYIQDVLKTPPMAVADWNKDGKMDLILGANHPSRMRHAFGTDPEVMRPLEFRYYVALNVGSDQATFAAPQMITIDGQPLSYFGFSYPNLMDLDKDGYPDLVCGEHYPGIKAYRNTGNGIPEVTEWGNLEDEDGNSFLSITYAHLESGDITGDGKEEIVATTLFSGTTYYYPLYATQDKFTWKRSDYLLMQGNEDTPIYGPAICVVEPCDWDEDGDTDILLGAEPGMPVILENVGDDKKKIFANPERIKFYDGTPLETYCINLGDGSSHGAWEWYDDRSLPTLADWDGDGVRDILSGTPARRLYWMKGKVIDGELRFGQPDIFRISGSELLHPHRTKPGVMDWDNDGKMDLVALNPVSELVVYLGNGNSNLQYTGIVYLKTTENKPLVGDLTYVEPLLHISQSGRTGIELFDWDNDGHIDIITHKHRGTVFYYRNTGDNLVFEPARVMFDFDSHLAGPAVRDWNNDGYPDIIMGGDRKRLVGEKKLYPTPIKAQLMWYDGRSLPFPPKKR